MVKIRGAQIEDGSISETELDAALAAKVNAVTVGHTHLLPTHEHPLSDITDAGDSAGLDVGTTAGTVAAGDHVHTGVYQPAGAYLDASSTLDATKLSGNLPALNGSGLTSLDGSNIASGTVADARLSANVPLKNAANTFTASQSISGTLGSSSLTLTKGPSNGSSPMLYLNGEFPSFWQNVKRTAAGTVAVTLMRASAENHNSTDSTQVALIGMLASTTTTPPTGEYMYFGASPDSSHNTNTAFRIYPDKHTNFQGLVGVGITTSPAYALHIAPTSGATAGQTLFVQDATASTGKTRAVFKAGAGDTAADPILQIQNNAGTVILSFMNQIREAADDTAAAALTPAVPVNGVYRTGSVLKIRIA